MRWYWIVHDDSAPDPDCLAALLAGADRNPPAAVLVPKTVGWSDPARLVGIGYRWSPGTPVVDRLEPWERDQGQYDVDRAVYSGDSAGMLVRADAWHALGGIDPTLGDWAGPTDLCRRVWGSGGDVVFIPAAVVAHRQAGHRGVRPVTGSRTPPRRRAREGQLLLELTQAPALAVPWRWLRGWVATLVRALALVLTREPEEATRGAGRRVGRPGPPAAPARRPSGVARPAGRRHVPPGPRARHSGGRGQPCGRRLARRLAGDRAWSGPASAHPEQLAPAGRVRGAWPVPRSCCTRDRSWARAPCGVVACCPLRGP